MMGWTFIDGGIEGVGGWIQYTLMLWMDEIYIQKLEYLHPDHERHCNMFFMHCDATKRSRAKSTLSTNLTSYIRDH